MSSKSTFVISVVSFIIIVTNAASDKSNATQQSVSSCNSMIPTNLRVFGMPDAYLVPDDPKNGKKDSGFFVDFLEAITKQSGLTYTLKPRPDLTFGIQQPNGSWDNSLINALLTDQADLVGADLTITSDREAVVDFLMPFGTYNLQILINTKFGPGISSGVQYLVQNDADLTFLKNSKNASIQAIYANVLAGKPNSLVANDTAGLAKLLTGNFAYITESPFPEKTVGKNPGIAKLNYNLGGFFLSLAVQQGSPLREKLNLAIIRLTEVGTLQSLINEYHLW